MKVYLVVLFFILAANAFALDATFVFSTEYKQLKSAAMSCTGNTCTCPEDTFVDPNYMKCMKCDVGLTYDPKVRQCFDETKEKGTSIKDFHFIKGAAIELLKNYEAQAPEVCEVKTAVDGKFKSCTCDPVVITIGSAKRGMRVEITRAFNVESQMCERSKPYIVKIDNLSCFGPREGAFDSLKKLALVEVGYDDPGYSLGTCGIADATHVTTLKKNEKAINI